MVLEGGGLMLKDGSNKKWPDDSRGDMCFVDYDGEIKLQVMDIILVYFLNVLSFKINNI